MLKKIFLALVLIIVVSVVAFAVVVALQPADYRVERTIKIDAPPEVVFAQVNDLRKWEAWSPWKKMEPEAVYTYTGPTEGKDAVVAWVGEKVGKGNMTILESHPPKHIKLKLVFLAFMESTSTTEFTFTADGDKTDVAWTMSGQNDFVSKAFHLVMDFDKMLGTDFEKGLAELKAVSEAAVKK